MEKTLNVAKVLYSMYFDKFQRPMDEMKMHKLMYFVQRESLMESKQFLFDEVFYGWKFGPVLKSVRSEYVSGDCFKNVLGDVTESTKKLLTNVFEMYGGESSWKLSYLSHDEFSWKRARKGLAAGENGDVALKKEDMMVDAMREQVRRNAIR